MQALADAVEAAACHAGGRPLQWREWKQHLMGQGEPLVEAEVSRLEAILTANGGEPSMKALLDSYAEVLEAQRQARAVLAGPEAGGRTVLKLQTELNGCAIQDAASWPSPLGPSRCAVYQLLVTEPGLCRLVLSPERPDLQRLLLLLSSRDGTLISVGVSRGPEHLCIERRLEPGKYSVTALPLRTWSTDAPDTGPKPQQLFTVTNGSVHLTDAYRHQLARIFTQWDWDCSGGLSRREFSIFNELTAGEPVRDDEWEIVLSNFETRSGELTSAGFLCLHQMEAEDNVSAPHELWVSLRTLGYDNDLVQRRAANFRLQLFTENPSAGHVALSVAALTPWSRNDTASVVRQMAVGGEAVAPGWRRVVLDHVVFYLYINLSSMPMFPAVNVTRCTNCAELVDRRRATRAVPPGGCAVVQCLTRADLTRAWDTEPAEPTASPRGS